MTHPDTGSPRDATLWWDDDPEPVTVAQDDFYGRYEGLAQLSDGRWAANVCDEHGYVTDVLPPHGRWHLCAI